MRRDLYSRPDDTPAVDADLAALPSFDLDYGFNDPADPSQLTLFDDTATDCELMTRWLTLEPVDVAVSLEAVR